MSTVVRNKEPVSEFIHFIKNESDFNSSLQKPQLFEPCDGKQVMDPEEKNGGGTDNTDGASISGGNVVFLSKAFGGWYEADGKLCLSLFREHVEESMKKDADGWQ